MLAGRFGEAGFMVLLERGTRNDVEAWCNTLLRKVAGHIFAIGGKSLSCTCSAGRNAADADEKNIDSILNGALQARAAAVEQGGGRTHVMASAVKEMPDQGGDKFWVKHIRSALMENRFRLMQQPIANLLGGERSMFDVLVRMVDEGGKEVLPAEFIAAAERNDLMKNIDRWVIGAAMSFCGSRPVQRLFVRLSKDSIADRSLPQWLVNQLKATRIDPARIAFQIDERVATEHLNESIELGKVLRQTGFKLALEHFGAGKDSVRLLQQLPVDYVKVDGTLMQSLAADHNVQETVRTIVDAAKQRQIATIAERIEDANTMAVLWQLGIEFIQGFFVNEPEQVTIG
jgi:EAL domain-containing protein (putative c-di-GMP-specific phosphodiesterase class I)